MLFVLCVVIGALIGRGSAAVQDSAKTALATCTKLENDDGTLRIDFRLAVNTDYDRRLIALDIDEYADGVYTSPSPACVMVHDPVAKTYHAQIMIDRSPFDGNTRNDNLCGAHALTSGNRDYWRVMFLHQTTQGDNINLLVAKDRVYMVDCYEDSLTANVINAADLEVARPVVQTVTPQTVLPTLIAQYQQSNGFWQNINSGANIIVGTAIRLLLHYNYGTYQDNIYVCAAGLQTLVSQYPQFTPTMEEFFDTDGCYANNKAPTQAFIVTDNGLNQPSGAQICKAETGIFPLWSWDSAPYSLYIRVYYELCHATDPSQKCGDPCAYNTGNLRRRRDAEEVTYSDIVINVYDPAATDGNNEKVEAESGVSGMMIGVIAGCVVVCVIACILLVAIVCFMKKRSSSEKGKYPPPGFENHDYNKY